jgi:hypothetical protein
VKPGFHRVADDEPEARAELPADALCDAGVVPDAEALRDVDALPDADAPRVPGLVADTPLLADGVDGAVAVEVEAAVVGCGVWEVRLPGAVDGPNVATDSIAPATRQTARMLASTGITEPLPPNGLVSRFSRSRRRFARCSRR